MPPAGAVSGQRAICKHARVRCVLVVVEFEAAVAAAVTYMHVM